MDVRGAYTVVIEPLTEEDGGGYLATVPDLPGCMSDCETRAEALANVEDAISTWLHCARKQGWAIREPLHTKEAANPDFVRKNEDGSVDVVRNVITAIGPIGGPMIDLRTGEEVSAD